METRYVFVDADSLLFRATYGDNVKDETMRQRFRERINFIKVNTWATDMFLAVKGKGNFRMEIDPTYKGNRPALTDEQKRRLNMLHSYAVDEVGAIMCDGWEADDQVRAWSYEADQENIPWIIAGIDKDLLQIPGMHFNYGGTEKKPMAMDDRWKTISPTEGDYRFACQLLTGDTSDNIFGIKGVGPKKAEKALADKDKKSMMLAVMDMYKNEYKEAWEDKLSKNCNLIYMRRWLDDEFDYRGWLK